MEEKKRNRSYAENRIRYYMLDGFRGICLISMILYHTVWDLVYLFGREIKWYQSAPGYLWQQSVCWSFILLSGFCWSMGKRKLRRGMLVFASGGLISLVTLIFMPQQRILFGILTLLGSCMLFMIPLEKILSRISSFSGLAGSILLFLLTRNAAGGSLGFERWDLLELPGFLYANLLTAYLGFPRKDFYSTDYFPLFPWMFLFISGYYLYRICCEREVLYCLTRIRMPVLEFLGKYSLVIYLVHQPVIYFLLEIV